MMRGVAGDLRLAIRSLGRNRAVTMAAILTLSLGIGATTAVFSVANGLILRPLPVTDPQRLATVTSAFALRFGFQAGAGWNYAMWDRLRQRAGAFDGAFAWTLQQVDGAEGGESRSLTALVASGGLFEALGVRAYAGRTFTAADDERGGGPDGAVLVISERLWERRFERAAGVLGSRLTVDGTPLTIVGIIPSGFRGLDVAQPFDVAMPFAAEALVHGNRSLRDNQGALLLTVMLRLRRGQTFPQATAALRSMQADIVGPRAPAFLTDPFIVVSAATGISDRSQLRQRYERPLVVLITISALVLAIVCVNIANLLLARAAARRYELSLRLAVGAPRWRLARHVVIEGLVLTAIGAGAGLVLSAWTSRALVAQLTAPTARLAIDLPVDWRVLVFTTAVSLMTIVLFGTAPALYMTRVAPHEALQERGRSPGADRTGVAALGLIVLQVALSIVLFAGASLFVRTFNRLVSVPLGFDPDGVLVVTIDTSRLPGAPSTRIPLYDRVREAVAAVPGVTRVAGSMWTPIGAGGGGVLTDARGRRAAVGPGQQVAFNFVTPGWFDTYGTALAGGRDFDARDRAETARVAIVNEAYRRALLPDRTAIGSTIDAGPCEHDGCIVVGVVADTVYGSSLRDRPPPMLYIPLAQAGPLRPDMPLRLSIRAASDNVARDVATILSRLDSRLTYRFRPLADDVDAAVSQERLVARLAGFFGAIALMLSAIGLYGVIAYTLNRRRGEIGIRLALGARSIDIVRAILTRIALSVLVGTLVGLAAAIWLARFIAPLLYGLETRDPATLVAVTVTMASVAVLAGWRPAARAMRVDPARVLRES